VRKVRRHAAACPTTAHFSPMSPSPSPRCAPGRGVQIHRITPRRPGVILRIVPVQAPFVDVVAQVIDTQLIRRIESNRVWSLHLPTGAVAFEGFLWRIAPGIQSLIPSVANRPFPLCFGRQAERKSRLVAEPTTVSHRVEPRYGYYRLGGIAKAPVASSRGHHITSCLCK